MKEVSKEATLHKQAAKLVKSTRTKVNYFFTGRGGGIVVSAFAFQYDNLSSNPASY